MFCKQKDDIVTGHTENNIFCLTPLISENYCTFKTFYSPWEISACQFFGLLSYILGKCTTCIRQLRKLLPSCLEVKKWADSCHQNNLANFDSSMSQPDSAPDISGGNLQRNKYFHTKLYQVLLSVIRVPKILAFLRNPSLFIYLFVTQRI